MRQRILELSEAIDLAYTLENLQGLLNRSRDGLQRILQIVKGLRTFARLDESELKEVDLNEGIESTLAIIRGNARKHSVELVLEPSPLPAVTCHPAQINQVVMNLVTNAIDACGTGGKVTIRTSATRTMWRSRSSTPGGALTRPSGTRSSIRSSRPSRPATARDWA